MKKIDKSIKLISGKFTAKEAGEIMFNLLNNKIQFHQIKNFACEERTGKTNVASKKRIEELSKAKEEVMALMREAETMGAQLNIQSVINIEFEKMPKRNKVAKMVYS